MCRGRGQGSRDTLLVRLVYLTSAPQTERIETTRRVDHAWRTNLLEERDRALQCDPAGSVEIRLGPHEIVTLELQLR